jgi:hypothetical protein
VGSNPLFIAAVFAGLAVFYLLPTIIGTIRQVEGLGWLIAFNLLLPGVGWLGGMVAALRLPRREPPVPYQPVTYDYPYQAKHPDWQEWPERFGWTSAQAQQSGPASQV